jgi:large subunit ribosomal protein L28
MAKYLGGVGVKTTGINKREFKPNIQKIRIQDKTGTVRRAKICTKCVRAGKVKKPMSRDIPEGLRNRMRAAEEAKSPEARRKAAAARSKRRRERRAAWAAKKG